MTPAAKLGLVFTGAAFSACATTPPLTQRLPECPATVRKIVNHAASFNSALAGTAASGRPMVFELGNGNRCMLGFHNGG